MEPAEKEKKKKKRGRLKAKSRRGGGGDGRGVERLSDLRTKTRRKWRRERGSGEREAGREKGEGGERPEKKDGEMILVGDWQSAAVVDSSTKGR